MRIAVIGVVVASVCGACSPTAQQAPTESAPVAVATTRVTVTAIASPFEAGGVVRPRATAAIASRVMAPIIQIHVRSGDQVRRGTTLVTLDARDILANKGLADATSRSAAEAARAAEADVRAAESTFVLAQATHERMASLHAKRSATTQELDQAVAALAAAAAQRTSAQARLAAAIAARDAAEASAEAAAINVSYAVLSAPFDGIVTERHADPGSMAMPGTPLLTLEERATSRLEVQLDEARTILVGIGQQVSVRLDNYHDGGDKWLDGRVSEIARIDPTSHRFLIKIDLPTSAALRSGLFGRARFSGPTRQALSVPKSAVINRGQLTFAYVVAGGRARLRPISTGSASDDRVEVLAGLREGDIVVTDPSPSLTDGERVAGGPR